MMATQKEIAKHLDLSERRVRDILKLIDVPTSGCSIEQARVEYIRYLRKRASGHIGADGVLDLTQERAKLAKAQTEKAELEVARLKGSLVVAVQRPCFKLPLEAVKVEQNFPFSALL
jgi:terminase small subunit / prophage DNA-packing protein